MPDSPNEAQVKTYRIATIPGDGIGKEVVPAGQQVLEALAQRQSGFGFEFTDFGWGGDWYRPHGVMMPDDGLDALRGMDAILFGSAGDPHIPDHVTLWGLRLKICQGFDQYANVRPTRILPGIDAPLKRCGPADLDWVIVRENSEGEYAGVGGRVHQGHPDRGGHRRVDDDARRRRAHHALCLPARAVAPAQAADGGHQVECAAPRHGDVGRDRGRDQPGVPRRRVGQGTGRRGDRAHGQPARRRSTRSWPPTCMPTS